MRYFNIFDSSYDSRCRNDNYDPPEIFTIIVSLGLLVAVVAMGQMNLAIEIAKLSWTIFHVAALIQMVASLLITYAICIQGYGYRGKDSLGFVNLICISITIIYFFKTNLPVLTISLAISFVILVIIGLKMVVDSISEE